MSNPPKIVNRKVFAEGAPIFHEGSEGDVAYIVLGGQVEIWRAVDGQRKRLGVVRQGGIFGEMALIDNRPRMASAAALEPTQVAIVTKSDFQQRMKDSDPVIAAVLRIMAEQIRRLTAAPPP